MKAKMTVDKAGRVVLPRTVRERMRLEPGKSLEIEVFDDHIVLRPTRRPGTMRKELGVWVFDSGEPVGADVVRETIQKIRDERSDQVSGIKR